MSVFCVVYLDVVEFGGEYFFDCGVVRLSCEVEMDEMLWCFWELSEVWVG